ncbi:MAG: thioredoxin fold domain-containing protein [Gammaproteobacteria bacterium]|nr:thioredoxin fold domain-containing protein [Gammaproteobacteria bacterium]
MKHYWLSLVYIAVCLFSGNTIAAAKNTASLGAVSYTIPGWFKDSFLEIKEDSAEARQENKQLILFMHMEGCPYCSRMLDENFREGKTKRFIEDNFQVVAINILGDREIIWDDNNRYIEKELARELKVHYTPTVVFMDGEGKRVLQLNGYRRPATLMHALNYVKDKQYNKLELAEYISKQNKPVYSLRNHPMFTKTDDFSDFNKPLAIIFEDKNCADCNEFHQKVLAHKEVLSELSKFTVVRLDTDSDKSIIDNNGNKTTAAAWAKKLKLDYRPGVVLFDKGSEVTRVDGRLYHFHFKEILRYVSKAKYFEYASYNQYLYARQKELRAAGIQIDFGQ